jgi:RNA polymerase sigma-70 factor (ECF subfamily)
VLFAELLFLLVSLTDGVDDVEFVRRIRAGDAHAFRDLFDRFHAPLYRYLMHRKVDPEVAEDLVQQTFVMVWERRDTLREDGSLRGLLFRIALTRALNHFRDTARFTDADPEDLASAVEPADPAEARDVRDALRAAVDSLPERRRAVFELCVLEGLTYRETAAALEISVKTVENQMVHALRQVREALAEYRTDSG